MGCFSFIILFYNHLWLYYISFISSIYLMQISKDFAYTLYAAMLALAATCNIEVWVFVMLTAFMIIDTIFWVAKAWRLESGTNPDWFSTKKLTIWFFSKIFILICIMSLGALTKQVLPDTEWNERTITGIMWLFSVAQLISMVQNTTVFHTWVAMNETDAITKVMSFILNKLKSFLEDKVNE